SEMLFSSAAESDDLLYSGAESAYQKILSSISIFENLAKFDNEFSEFLEDLQSALLSVKEASRFASDLKNRVDFDKYRIEHLRERSAKLRVLIKKFGPLDKIIDEKVELEKNIDSAENYDYNIDQLNQRITEEEKLLIVSGKTLNEFRKKHSLNLIGMLNEEFSFLGMDNAEFKIEFVDPSEGLMLNDGRKVNPNGLELVNFKIATNKGQAFADLNTTVSGGEMSRIVLALKKILKEKEKIDLLVFDEIDTGISGKTAAKVGKYIKSLSNKVQILSITHQPQIAAGAQRHILVEKLDINDASLSIAKILNLEDSIKETAKLFSGEVITEESLKSAKNLFES
ncbi:hypothetical protein OAQ99_03355, partial [Candidatus Kapabacteria bacterium]|nr:hypothetical protein [Candidatus Kapabacteria bacterium]